MIPDFTGSRLHADDVVGDNSLSTMVYASILGAIHSKELKPGDQVTEIQIAERLGISRSPVREAFARLVSQGLLVRSPRRGTHVARPATGDVEDLRDCRMLIEGYAARLAADRISDDDVDALRQVIDRMIAAARKGGWIETVRANAKFHESVILIGGNVMLHRMWQSLDPLAWLVADTMPPGHRHDPTDLEQRHTHLLDELLSGDATRAEQAFREHVFESVDPERMVEED